MPAGKEMIRVERREGNIRMRFPATKCVSFHRFVQISLIASVASFRKMHGLLPSLLSNVSNCVC